MAFFNIFTKAFPVRIQGPGAAWRNAIMPAAASAMRLAIAAAQCIGRIFAACKSRVAVSCAVACNVCGGCLCDALVASR
jgi:hypothetical protein